MDAKTKRIRVLNDQLRKNFRWHVRHDARNCGARPRGR